MTKLTEMFDYGSITEEQKAAALEIVQLCKNMDQHIAAEIIKHKFQLVEPKRYNMEESAFIKACADAGIYVSIQGHIKENAGTPDELEYQLVSISQDIRKMDEFVEKLKK
jgi:hypothetical protein